MAHDTTLDPQQRQEAIQTLQQLIGDIHTAMLTTVMPDGSLRSRPMETARTHFDGDLWFFTEADAPKVAEIEANPHVNVVYAQPDTQRFVSMSGRVQVVRDRKRMEVLWNPQLKEYFPEGLDDPKLALLRVDIDLAEYWDASTSSLMQLGGTVRSVVTGEPRPSEHEQIRWPR